MGNLLLTLGVLCLLFIAFVYLFSIFYPENQYLIQLKEQKFIYLFLYSSLACFALSLVLKILSPVKKVFKNRCKKCNTPIPQGDIYCSTCLRDLKNNRY